MVKYLKCLILIKYEKEANEDSKQVPELYFRIPRGLPNSTKERGRVDDRSKQSVEERDI